MISAQHSSSVTAAVVLFVCLFRWTTAAEETQDWTEDTGHDREEEDEIQATNKQTNTLRGRESL